MIRALAFAALTSGCTASTSDIQAHIDVLARDRYLSMSVLFTDSDYGNVKVGDRRVVMSFRGVEYEAGRYDTVGVELDEPIAAEEPVVVTVERDGESPVSSTVLMPPPPILEPIPLFISREDDLVLTWAPVTDDPMEWRVEDWSTPLEFQRSCGRGYGEIPPGEATVTIAMDALRFYADYSTCTAVLAVGRWREVPVDPAFGGGQMIGAISQSVPFASTP